MFLGGVISGDVLRRQQTGMNQDEEGKILRAGGKSGVLYLLSNVQFNLGLVLQAFGRGSEESGRLPGSESESLDARSLTLQSEKDPNTKTSGKSFSKYP